MGQVVVHLVECTHYHVQGHWVPILGTHLQGGTLLKWLTVLRMSLALDFSSAQ